MSELKVAQTVLVTGTSTGFGMETALYLAERGLKVYASMRDLTRRGPLEAAARRRNVNLRVLELDVTKPATIEAAVQTIIAEDGALGSVVNNAGLFLRGYFEDCSDQEIQRVFEANVFGMMAVTRAVLPHMRAARCGRIIIISSVAGRIAAPTSTAYSASRFAQEGFAESLHQELSPLGISVSLVESGISKTESWTIDSGVSQHARDSDSAYHAWFMRAEQLFDQRLQASPISARDVAAVVHRALTDRRPHLRYIVGLLPKLVINARRYSPGELFDRVYFGEIMRRITNKRNT